MSGNNEQFDITEKYNKDWNIQEILKVLQQDIDFIQFRMYGYYDDVEKSWESEDILAALWRINSELLSRSPPENSQFEEDFFKLDDARIETAIRVEQLVKTYWYFCREIEELQIIVKKPFQILRLTTQITFSSSLIEVALLTFNAVHWVFNLERNPKIFFVSTLIQVLTMVASLFVLSYIKHSTISVHSDVVRDEINLYWDMMKLHKEGIWIDEKVRKVFPHGIDPNLDVQEVSSEISWGMEISFMVILTNIQKNIKLLEDETFLTKVRVFVESNAAFYWYKRMHLKKLLEETKETIRAIPLQIILYHKLFYYRAALPLFPILISWLLNRWNSTEKKIIFCGMSSVMIFRNLLWLRDI